MINLYSVSSRCLVRLDDQGHVKITACAELITVSSELWNTAAPECPAQSTFSLKCSLASDGYFPLQM